MAENSNIQWTHHTFNAWIGCIRKTEGCVLCYAEILAASRMSHFGKLWGPNSDRHRTTDNYWKQPFKWNRKAKALGERHRVFLGSMMDFFEDNPKVILMRKEMWEIIRQTPDLDWLILTKRPENIIKFLPEDWGNGWHNVWIGTSYTGEKDKQMINDLVNAPAYLRFLSMEPLLGATDITNVKRKDGSFYNPLEGLIDWVILGGESGSKEKSRPCNVNWMKKVVRDCKEFKVPVFVKQLGTNPVYPSKATSNLEPFPVSSKKGDIVEEFPEELRVMEFPIGSVAKEIIE
jgi:protein gp37